MDVSEAIRLKRAVREFQDQVLPAAHIHHILNAGRRAQSAKNRQLWHFIALQERGTLQALAELGSFAGHLAGAALGVVIATPDPAIRWSIMFDAGQAAAYMQLAAWELGIGSCLATIYEPQKAGELLNVPAEFFVQVALSFGYPLELDVMSAEPRLGGRKQFDEIMHSESW